MAFPSRFVWLGLATTLCLIWLLSFFELRDPRDLIATAKSRLHGEGTPTVGNIAPHNRPLVLYAYAESGSGRADLEYFVRNGVHRRADFVFIFNGETNATDMIPDLPNVWTVQRNNTCFDMGAFGEVLRTNNLWKRYKRFITMNASIRGPFLPVYSSACWTDLFLDRITDHNKLIGLSMNCHPRPHVQSMLWATDSVGMSVLLDSTLAYSVGHDDNFGTKDDPVGLTPCYDNWWKAVHAEVGTTELMMSQGYGVDVLLASYHGQNGTMSYCDATDYPQDHFRKKGYFGSTIHPYETVFVKANRGIDESLLEHMTSWHMTMNHTSWDTCGP